MLKRIAKSWAFSPFILSFFQSQVSSNLVRLTNSSKALVSFRKLLVMRY